MRTLGQSQNGRQENLALARSRKTTETNEQQPSADRQFVHKITNITLVTDDHGDGPSGPRAERWLA
jgi:hypothetical protein